MAPRQQQRLAADLAVELAKGDERARERDSTDQDTDIDFHLVDGFLYALQLDRGVHITGKPHEAGRQAHQAVHERDQLGHLGHLDDLGGVQADAAANHQCTNDPCDAHGADARAEHRGQHGQRHADHAEQVAAA